MVHLEMSTKEIHHTLFMKLIQLHSNNSGLLIAKYFLQTWKRVCLALAELRAPLVLVLYFKFFLLQLI